MPFVRRDWIIWIGSQVTSLYLDVAVGEMTTLTEISHDLPIYLCLWHTSRAWRYMSHGRGIILVCPITMCAEKNVFQSCLELNCEFHVEEIEMHFQFNFSLQFQSDSIVACMTTAYCRVKGIHE